MSCGFPVEISCWSLNMVVESDGRVFDCVGYAHHTPKTKKELDPIHKLIESSSRITVCKIVEQSARSWCVMTYFEDHAK